MIAIRRLPLEMREKLKAPLGILIQGSFDETMKELRRLVLKEKPVKLVAVGDCVSENMISHSFNPQVLIVDNKIMRKTIQPIQLDSTYTLHTSNPPGTLTEDAWNAVAEAMKQTKQTKVVVDGEEDLLTLVAVLSAPNNSLVVYGQPHEGIVVVRVNEQKKLELQQIVNSMELVSKS